MLSLGDPRWDELTGGYKVPYDPSAALSRLERGEVAWDELWEELHHQGDAGAALYAAVPHLVRIGRSSPKRDWNLYGLVSMIEIERHRKLTSPGSRPLPGKRPRCRPAPSAVLPAMAHSDAIRSEDSGAMVLLVKGRRLQGSGSQGAAARGRAPVGCAAPCET